MKIKDFFNQDYNQWLVSQIDAAVSTFDKAGFAAFLSSNITDQEYTKKLLTYVEAFDLFLPEYSLTVDAFRHILGPPLTNMGKMYEAGIWYSPMGRYIEAHAAEHPECFEQTILFVKELTKRYTGEFAMRPLIRAFPEKTMPVLLSWADDESEYVRRCASECMRISLPWAKKMTVAIDSCFETYAYILGKLRHDENKYVRRSVANNLNDLFKYDAAKAQSIIDH